MDLSILIDLYYNYATVHLDFDPMCPPSPPMRKSVKNLPSSQENFMIQGIPIESQKKITPYSRGESSTQVEFSLNHTCLVLWTLHAANYNLQPVLCKFYSS